MKKLFAIVITALLLITSCYADEAEDVTDALPESVKDTVGSIEDISDTQSLFQRLFASIKSNVSESIAQVIKKMLAVMAVAVICGILGIFGTKEMPEYIPLAACAAVCAVCIGDVGSYIKLGTQAVNDISLYSKTLLPAMCSLTAACGNISSAAVRFAASALFMDIFISAAQKFVIPLIYAYLALILAACAFSNTALKNLASLMKWVCKSLMTVLTLVFTIYITVSGAIAKSGDAVATRLTKTAISSFLPLVGSIISDAASSVVAGAELIKNTVGAFGLAAVAAMCISPLAVLFVNYLGLKATEAGVGAINVKPVSELVGGVGTAFSMLMGLVGTCALIMFISLISCIRTVTG